MLEFFEANAVALVLLALAVLAACAFAMRKKVHVERQGDTVTIEVDDRSPRVEKRGNRVVIEFRGQRVDIPPDWQLAAPELVVNRWITGEPPAAYLSIAAGERLLFKGTRADGELMLAAIRKQVGI